MGPGQARCEKKRFFTAFRMTLLCEAKAKGAKARSSEELKFLSSQATLSYRVAVATDALIPRRRYAQDDTLIAIVK